MMINPHNHLYCEQYAEVGNHLDICHQIQSWSYVVYSDVMLSLLELPFNTACCLCLMPPHTGEVHSGGAGKPGAVQEVFCPGAEAE